MTETEIEFFDLLHDFDKRMLDMVANNELLESQRKQVFNQMKESLLEYL